MNQKPCIVYDSQIFDYQRFGGISRYFCEIISRIHMNYDIAVRYSNNYYLNDTKLGKHRIPLPRFLYKHYEQKIWHKNQKLAKQLLQSYPNCLLHATYYEPYFLNFIESTPYVITVHDMTYEKFPQLFSESEHVIKQKKEVITRANRIIAISENTKKDIIELLHVKPEKIDVIYHGTSMHIHKRQPSLRLPKRFILFVGSRCSYKNFNRFLNAFALVSHNDKELFAICTGVPFNPDEEQRIEKLNLKNRILQFNVSDKQLEELYSQALLFVYPSLYEGFGIPILEAYACHCPVALSRASCFPEIANEAAIYFDPYSEEDMARAIKKVIYNENQRILLIEKGKERLKLYSWEKATEQTEQTYQKVLQYY